MNFNDYLFLHKDLAAIWVQVILGALQLLTLLFFFYQFWKQRRDRHEDEIRNNFLNLSTRLSEVIRETETYRHVFLGGFGYYAENEWSEIGRARSVDQFLETVHNFMLAHRGEGLRALNEIREVREGEIRRLNLFLALEFLRRNASRPTRQFLQSFFLSQVYDAAINGIVMQAFLSAQPEIVQIVFNFGAPYDAVYDLEPRAPRDVVYGLEPRNAKHDSDFRQGLRKWFPRNGGAINARITLLLGNPWAKFAAQITQLYRNIACSNSAAEFLFTFLDAELTEKKAWALAAYQANLPFPEWVRKTLTTEAVAQIDRSNAEAERVRNAILGPSVKSDKHGE